MRYVAARLRILAFVKAEPEEIKTKLAEAMNIACTYLEQELKHDSIEYDFLEIFIDSDEED